MKVSCFFLLLFTCTNVAIAESDFYWLNGNSRQTEFPLETAYFTGQFLFDANYIHDFNNPQDHTLAGSSNSGRTSEFQIQQFGIGGDLHYKGIRGRLMTQLGMYSTMTPRNDASTSRGQWKLEDVYRYVSEAYGGYHFDVWNGINVDVGIFMSYIGLCSYYNSENWIYQMSYVSANTPWFFNGLRVQTFPSEKLKIEYWLINGWQSYGMFHEMPGLGVQVLWRPNSQWSFVSNDYFGFDTLDKPGRMRFHSDNSVQHKYYDNSNNWLGKAAFSLTLDGGCENGDGVTCASQYFLGAMAYHRLWFAKDQLAFTVGAGAINNPGRYLVILPPINGATASTGSTYFSTDPGTSFIAWDASATFDYMPNQFLTLRLEYIHRQANVDYFAGQGGMSNSNQAPDLRPSEDRINLALLIRI